MAGHESHKSESVVQFNARFSTIMSDRDNDRLVDLKRDRNAFMIPKSFSQAVTSLHHPLQAPNSTPTDRVVLTRVSEYSPQTDLVKNTAQNSKQPTSLSNSLSLPPGFELNFGESIKSGPQNMLHQPEVVEENVDGEESKETPLSDHKVRGATFLRRG